MEPQMFDVSNHWIQMSRMWNTTILFQFFTWKFSNSNKLQLFCGFGVAVFNFVTWS